MADAVQYTDVENVRRLLLASGAPVGFYLSNAYVSDDLRVRCTSESRGIPTERTAVKA